MQENVNYFAERGIADGHHRLVDIGRHMNDMLADWDPEGHQEHAGISPPPASTRLNCWSC